MVHADNVAFADSVNYRTYRLHSPSQIYNGKMAARAAQVAKRMRPIIKPYKFEDSDQATKLSFLRQLKKACDSNGVLKGVAMWLPSFFMLKSLAAPATIQMTPGKDPREYLDGHRRIVRQSCSYTYVEAVCYPPNSYATKGLIAKAGAKTDAFKQFPGQKAVSFAKTFRDKALSCGDAFSEQRTKSIFKEWVPLKVRDNMRMYWAARPAMHLCQIAHYPDRLIQLSVSTSSSSTRERLPRSTRRGGRDDR